FALGMREGNGVSADVLGDAAGFARGDVGLADDVEEAGFTVVDVAHDGDDGGARLEVLGLVFHVELDLLDGRVNDAAAAFAFFDFETETVERADFLGDCFVDGLVDGGENAHLHQVANDDERFLLHLFGEVANDDGRFDGDDLGIGGQRNFGTAGFLGRGTFLL